MRLNGLKVRGVVLSFGEARLGQFVFWGKLGILLKAICGNRSVLGDCFKVAIKPTERVSYPHKQILAHVLLSVPESKTVIDP